MKGEGLPRHLADWSRLIENFGDVMEQTNDYARRYRVREFPAEKPIDAIGPTEVG